jgi:hypothetical protein
MINNINYLIRSKVDGKYLVANVSKADNNITNSYLLVFREDFEALSYINTHGKEFSDRLAVESVSSTQLKGLLQRWGYQGIALVEDPLVPRISFMSQEYNWI